MVTRSQPRRPLQVDSHEKHHQDTKSLRTASLTPSSSIATAFSSNHTIEVPELLQSLFFGGLETLPFAAAAASSTTIPEEDDNGVIIEDDHNTTLEVPCCVKVAEATPLPATEAASSPPVVEVATKADTEELKELLRTHPQIQQQRHSLSLPLPPRSKKKKTSKRLKAAAKKVFLPFSSSSTGPKKKRSSSSKSIASASQASRSSPLFTISAQNMEEKTPISALSSFNFDDEESNHCSLLEDKVSVEDIRQVVCQQEQQVHGTSRDIQDLQTQLAHAIAKYQTELSDLQATQQQLEELLLVKSPGITTTLCTKKPSDRVLQRSASGSFMRIADLDLTESGDDADEKRRDSFSSLSQSAQSLPKTPEFLLMDHHLLTILQQLVQKGYDLAIDEEGDRYTATRDTARLIVSNQSQQQQASTSAEWPITPWTPAYDQHVLVWSGRVSHGGFGHTWPVVKGRAILNTSARGALECLWDSQIVAQYNPMCQGRDDVYVIQDNVHTTAHESQYGFAGCAKIVRSLNKHRLLPKAIEMKSLLYAKPLTFDGSKDISTTTVDNTNDDLESYILVSRSVWENDSATLDPAAAKAVIRTEMLLGCTILRALSATTCEMTQMSHVHSPGVPEMLARRAAPGQCHNLMKALQAMFPPSP